MIMQDNEKKPALRFKGFTDPWEQRKLEEYLEVSGQKNFDGIYSKEDVLSVSGDFGIVNQIEFQGRSFAGASVANYGVVETGDIVYTKSPLKSNPYGIIKANKGKNGIVSTLYAVYKPKQSANPEFVQIYFEQDARMNNYMHPLVNKGAKNDMKVSAENALKGQIVFPDIEEQRTISEFFRNLDTLITLHQRKYEKLVNIKKSMLDKMFPQNGVSVPEIRFKGFTDPWEQRKLEEYLEVSGQKNFEGIYTKEDVLSVSGDFGIVNQIEFQGRSFAGASVANYGVVETGDIVYTKSPLKSNPYGIIKANKGKNGIVSTLYAVYKPKQSANPEFVQIYFEQDARMNNYMHPLVNKGAKNDMKVSAENALKGQIVFPDIEEQRTISEFFRNLDTLITLHQRKYEKLVNIKKSMLDKMFPQNGVSVPEIRFKGFTDPWEQRKLKELYFQLTERNADLLPYQKTLSVATMSFKTDGNGAADTSLANYKRLRTGDIAFEGHTSKEFRYGRFVLNDVGDGIMSPRFSALRPLHEMPINFWKYYIHYEPIMRKVLVNSTKAGTMMNELVINEFLQESILVPSVAEQQAIGRFFKQLDTLITLHQREHIKLILEVKRVKRNE